MEQRDKLIRVLESHGYRKGNVRSVNDWGEFSDNYFTLIIKPSYGLHNTTPRQIQVIYGSNYRLDFDTYYKIYSASEIWDDKDTVLWATPLLQSYADMLVIEYVKDILQRGGD